MRRPRGVDDIVGKLGVHQVAQRTGEPGIERPAGGEHEVAPVGRRVDAGRIPRRDRGAGHTETKRAAVAAGDADLVTGPYLAEKRKARVAMRSARAGLMTGADG